MEIPPDQDCEKNDSAPAIILNDETNQECKMAPLIGPPVKGQMQAQLLEFAHVIP